MGLADRFVNGFRRILPSPFTIAILLTFLTLLIAFFFSDDEEALTPPYFLKLLSYWNKKLWDLKLIVFAFQMMLMLVLGHVLALTRPVDQLIRYSLRYCTNTANSALMVTLLTVAVSLFNWGLGLIFGAIFARKVGEHALRHGYALNYPLVGASGYAGLMVWHGGISGSSLIKAAEPGNLQDLVANSNMGIDPQQVPEVVSFSETGFSTLNIVVSVVLLLALPAAMYWLGGKVRPEKIQLTPEGEASSSNEKKPKLHGAEKLDHSIWVAMIAGAMILGYAIYKAWFLTGGDVQKFFKPNNINLLLLGMCLLLHQSFARFLRAIDKAISGASGILIQFPLYFGILGILSGSGMIKLVSEFFVSISTETTYPIYTFFSAGLVNFFVPSGGGQWAVQGPIVVSAAISEGYPLHKCILALAYGDQLTNMLQPFWALPLLGITGLKARDILPYTAFLMLVGIVIFIAALLIF